MTLPRTLSHSSIELYTKCPAAWHARYALREPAIPTPAMAFGRAAATALEVMHRGGDWAAAFRTEHTRYDWLLRGYRAGIRPGLAYGLELLDLYRERGPYPGEPERKFVLHLPTYVGVPVPIVGYLDLAHPDRPKEFKTSSAAWTLERAKKEPQAACYWWASIQLYGRPPECIGYVVLSTDTPAITELDVRPGHEEVRAFEAAARATWDGIAAGAFEPCGKVSRCEFCRRKADAGVTRLRCRRGRGGEDSECGD